MSLRFAQQPPVQQIRSALESKLPGEISVQQVSGKPEVLIGTEIKDEKELNANRQLIEDTLRGMFSGTASGMIDLNNSSATELADRLRGPLQQAGVALSEQDLQDLCTAIDDLSGRSWRYPALRRRAFRREGRDAQGDRGSESQCEPGAVHNFVDRRGGSQDRRRAASCRPSKPCCTRWPECWCISPSALNGFMA